MPQNAGNAFSETQIFKIFQGGMPPDPPRSSRLTACAKDAFGAFQYLSAYFSNSAIYSISYWKPCVMQAFICPDECDMYWSVLFDFRQNRWNRQKETPKIAEDNQQLHDSVFVFSKFTTKVSFKIEKNLEAFISSMKLCKCQTRWRQDEEICNACFDIAWYLLDLFHFYPSVQIVVTAKFWV